LNQVNQLNQMITQKDIAAMSDSELAALAAKAPAGMSPIWDSEGWFAFIADSVLAKITPSQRAKITVIGRNH
jgi:hypothetical protein